MSRFKTVAGLVACGALIASLGLLATGCAKEEAGPEATGPEELMEVDFDAMEEAYLPVLLDYQAVELGQMAPADSQYVDEAFVKGLEQYGDATYTFVDIAGDSVPELLVGFSGLEALDDTGTPATYRLYGIYTIDAEDTVTSVAPAGMGDAYDAYLCARGVVHLQGTDENGVWYQRITELLPGASEVIFLEGVDQSDALYYSAQDEEAREIDEGEADELWGTWESKYPVYDGADWEWRVLKDFSWEPTEGAPVDEVNEYYTIDLSGELEGATAEYDDAWHDQGEGDIGIGHSTDVFSADGEYLFSVACYTGDWGPEGIIVSEELGTFTDNEGREVTAYIFKSTEENDAAAERDHAKLLEYKDRVSFG